MNKFIKEYQCPGCVCSDSNCYKPTDDKNISCFYHITGSYIPGVGKVFLGLPKGFNTLGPMNKQPISIYKKFKDGFGYDRFNIPVWKYLNENGHTIVRGISPRINSPFIHIFLEDCMNKIDCLKITNKDIKEMD